MGTNGSCRAVLQQPHNGSLRRRGRPTRLDIGRVLDSLEASGELDNTCVLFLSDNGAEGAMWEAQPLAAGANLMEHIAKYHDNSLDNIGAANSFVWYGPQWASASTAPGRLFKMYTSEGGIRVPCVMRYPRLEGVEGGRVEHAFTAIMDIFPTLLDMAGVALPSSPWKGREVAAVKGRSWLPYLKGAEIRVHDETETTG